MLSLAALLVISPAHADEDEARTCIHAKVRDAWTEGLSVRASTTDTVKAGEVEVYGMTLQAGNRYRIFACGDVRVADVGLYVYDPDGQVVARDESVDREPRVDYSPTETGRYFVVVQAASLVGDAASGAIATAVTFQ